MTEDTLIYVLRVVCLCGWLLALAAASPSALRYVRGHYADRDQYLAGFWFVSLVFVISIGRLLMASGDNSVFIVNTSLAIALAVYVVILCLQGRKA